MVKLYNKTSLLLQHNYSKAPLELEPKFCQIIHKTSLHPTTQLLQGSSVARAKIWSNYTRQSLHTTAQPLQGSSGARAKIWSNYTKTKPTYVLQHSYTQTSVELGPQFGQIIQQDKPNTTAQIIPHSSRPRAKIWSNYTTRVAYGCYSKASLNSLALYFVMYTMILQSDITILSFKQEFT